MLKKTFYGLNQYITSDAWWAALKRINHLFWKAPVHQHTNCLINIKLTLQLLLKWGSQSAISPCVVKHASRCWLCAAQWISGSRESHLLGLQQIRADEQIQAAGWSSGALTHIALMCTSLPITLTMWCPHQLSVPWSALAPYAAADPRVVQSSVGSCF